jgi:tRNA(Ile)-lysidine synthase
LIHLIRGGGEKTLNTLPIWDGKYFRPLVKLKRLEIENFFTIEKDWSYFEDETNDSEIYLRNRIRKNISPLFATENLDLKKLYTNFHEDIYLEKKESKDYFMIHKDTFPLGLFDLKNLLDTYLKILNLNPINKKILFEIHRVLNLNQVLEIENHEFYIWKSPSSDFYIFKMNSGIFRFPIQKNEREFIWNHQNIHLKEGEFLKTYSNGDKLFHNHIHKEVSELLRANEIPKKLRKYIPIIFTEKGIQKILLSYFTQTKKDILSSIE